MNNPRSIFRKIYKYRASMFVYIWIGGLSAFVNWIFFYVLAIPLEWHYGFAAVAAFMIATAVNYVLSEAIGFLGSGRSRIVRFLGVYFVSAIGLCVDVLVLAVLYEFLEVNVMASKIAGTAAAFAVNFAGRQFWVFLRQPRWTSLSSLTRELSYTMSRIVMPSSSNRNGP